MIKREFKRVGLTRELKSDLNNAIKGQSLKKLEPCPLGACSVLIRREGRILKEEIHQLCYTVYFRIISSNEY